MYFKKAIKVIKKTMKIAINYTNQIDRHQFK